LDQGNAVGEADAVRRDEPGDVIDHDRMKKERNHKGTKAQRRDASLFSL
jgi:hypothetical protein